MHKLAQHHTHSAIVLFELWESLDVLFFDEDCVQDAIARVISTTGWKGTLQDASVIIMARQVGIEI